MKNFFAVGFVSFLCSSAAALAQSPVVPVGEPKFEDYRRQFAMCDASNVFEKVNLPIKNAKGNTIWYDCSDRSNLARLESIAAKDGAPATIIFESKIAHDDDGSKKSCSADHGSTSQCTTSLMLRPASAAQCPAQIEDRPYCLPTDPDVVPFFVIPGFGPKGIDGKEFSKKTHVGVGDYGVVIYKDKVVAAVVADEGPAYKIGEGSTLLLKKLTGSGSGTQDRGVVFIVFPGTADKVANLKLETLPALVSQKGCAKYAALVGKDAAKGCQ